MTTKTKKKAVRKKATKATPVTNNKVTLTATQAKNIQAYLAKNKKSFKFLDTKIEALNA